jgi:hypothetical protein
MSAATRNIVLVAAHFAPSNLVNVHRARLWSQYLPDLGWNPIVVTTHHDYYEERLDWDLHALIDPSLEVVRTRALPTRPVRVVGDIGLRALLPHYRALCRLAAAGRMDFLHITIPSNYSAMLGRMVHARYGTPYGIDYNDPWVHAFPGSDQRWTKAWGSARLAEVLEPWAVKDASLITGVAESYFADVLERHPGLREQAVIAAMPFGVSEADYEHLQRFPRKSYLFDPDDGRTHLMYAGAILPKAHGVLDRLMQALALLREREPATLDRIRLHFIGTGKRADDPNGYNVQPYIERYRLGEYVDEQPMRVPYLDVLHHLQAAHANLILGSTEPHYTPSKAFQVVRARKPTFAVLHSESTAASLLNDLGAGSVLTLNGTELPSVDAVADRFGSFLRSIPGWRVTTDFRAFETLTARHSTKVLVEAVEQALNLRRDRAASGHQVA